MGLMQAIDSLAPSFQGLEAAQPWRSRGTCPFLQLSKSKMNFSTHFGEKYAFCRELEEIIILLHKISDFIRI